MYESGKIEESPNAKGLAFMISKTSLCKKFEHSDKIISCKIDYRETYHYKSDKSMPLHVTITTKLKIFYEELEKAVDKKASSHHIVMGDFNAITGVRNI